MDSREAFGQNVERYRDVVEEQTELVCRYLPDLTLTFVNPAYCRYFGTGPEDLIGRTFLDHIPQEDHALYEEIPSKLSREAPARTVEHAVFAPGGDLRWLQWTDRAIFGDDGDLIEYQSVGRDVTERREVEDALRSSQRLLAGVLQSSLDGVMAFVAVRDPDGSIADFEWVLANPVSEQIVGCPEDELLGKKLLTEMPGMEEEGLFEAFERVVETERPFEGEVYYEHEGISAWLRLTVVKLGDGFVMSFVDVSERKEAERASRRGQDTLAEAERMAHLGSWEWDLRTDVVTWSDEVYRIYGLQPEVSVPSMVMLLEAVHPEDEDVVVRAQDQAFHEHQPYDIEHRVVRPDGHVRIVQSRAKVVRSDDGAPSRMIGTVYDVTERKALEERLRHQAFHDSLTGLPNRNLLMDRLRTILGRTERRHASKAAVYFVDLDDFKVVNESLGHEAGDELLIKVAERLRRGLRLEDTLARFGGDEFVILVEEVATTQEAARIAARLVEQLREPYYVRRRQLYVAASVGVAVGDADTNSPQDLLRDGNTAMYAAKREGAAHKLFHPTMHAQAYRRLERENDLRRAIEKEEFVVHYQPIVQCHDDGNVWGMEALVRWNHPERGLLNPSEFVATAEESGLVVPMGEQVLRQACRQAASWQEGFRRTPPLVVNVNLSATELARPELTRTVEVALQESGLEAHCLGLEVTETMYVQALEGNTASLDRLRAAGVRIVIDDFGIGYSSLSYLKRLPADALKIDHTFVAGLGYDVEDTAIVRLVVELAHTLGMELIAEGVETREQVELLMEMGCDFMQGFYFARPMPPEELHRFMPG